MNAIIKLSSPETREFWKIPVLHEDDAFGHRKPGSYQRRESACFATRNTRIFRRSVFQ